MENEWMDALDHYITERRYSSGQVAELSGIPQRTIINWRNGRVRKPQRWQDVVKIAAALGLNQTETNELLQAARHQTLLTLRRQATRETDKVLLSPWPITEAPFQAIADLPYFVGRDIEIQAIEDTLRKGHYVAICSLLGMGGVGKSSLAAHLTYRLRSVFPDGVLWASLDVMDTMSILNAFAGTLGEDVSRYLDVASRSGAVRSLLADKQVLMVLDNAQNSAQVRPLLPPTTGKAAVIVTTRYDLAVVDDMVRFQIEPFDPHSENSLSVFTYFLGKTTVRRWRAQLQKIADLLGHLPLAIAIAAGRLAAQMTIPDYLAQLQTADLRLQSLVREDRSVRLSFDVSYQMLSSEMEPFFSALGSFGGENFGIEAAAFVAETPVETAQTFLDRLVQLSLVQSPRPMRYRLHALLRDYALEQQQQDDPIRRMVSFFVEYVAKNGKDMQTTAREISNVIAGLEMAEKLAMHEDFVAGVNYLSRYWYTEGSSLLSTTYLNRAVSLAKRMGLQQQEATAHSNLGSMLWMLGQVPEAEEHFREALSLTQACGDKPMLSKTLINYSQLLAYNHGDYDSARELLHNALKIAREIEHPYLLYGALNTLANVAYEQGDWGQTMACWEEALPLSEMLEGMEKNMIANTYLNMAVISSGRGDYQQATRYLESSLALAEELNFIEHVSLTLAALARVELDQGKTESAEVRLNKALQLSRKMQHPESSIRALLGLGVLAARRQTPTEAISRFDEALALSREAKIPWNEIDVLLEKGQLYLDQQWIQQAEGLFQEALTKSTEINLLEALGMARFGLAQTRASQGDLVQGIQLATESLSILERLGHQKASEVRAWLQEQRGMEPS